MREAAATVREAHWASDETVTHCKMCTTEFSLARRKVGQSCFFYYCTNWARFPGLLKDRKVKFVFRN